MVFGLGFSVEIENRPSEVAAFTPDFTAFFTLPGFLSVNFVMAAFTESHNVTNCAVVQLAVPLVMALKVIRLAAFSASPLITLEYLMSEFLPVFRLKVLLV